MNKKRSGTRILHTEMGALFEVQARGRRMGRSPLRESARRPFKILLDRYRLPRGTNQGGLRQLRYRNRRQILARWTPRNALECRRLRRRLDDPANLRRVNPVAQALARPSSRSGFSLTIEEVSLHPPAPLTSNSRRPHQGSSVFALFCRSRMRTARGFSMICFARMMHQ